MMDLVGPLQWNMQPWRHADTPFSSFPCAQVQALQAEADGQAAEVARLHGTTPEQLYAADLDAFEAALDARDVDDAAEADLLRAQRMRAGGGGGRGGGGAAAKVNTRHEAAACVWGICWGAAFM
jgi:DNA topoisomerase-2